MIRKHSMGYAMHYCILDLTMMTDKKNENKKVDVEDFLPAEAAAAAIKHSMWVSLLSFFLINNTPNPASWAAGSALDRLCYVSICDLNMKDSHCRDLYATYIIESLRQWFTDSKWYGSCHLLLPIGYVPLRDHPRFEKPLHVRYAVATLVCIMI